LFMPPTRSRLEHYNAFKDPSWPTVVLESDIDALSAHIKTEVNWDYQNISNPEYIQTLQKMTYPEMQDFKGQTFLEWSRKNGYEVTAVPSDHPLEQAHRAAADLWRSKYQQQLQ